MTLVAIGTCTIQAVQTGNANWSAAPNVNQSFTVTPPAQTITFPAIPPQLWGNSQFTVNATASSGLPVAYVTLTPTVCSIADITATLVNVGSCTLLATQAGNATYLAANASQTFPVIAPLQFASPIDFPTGLYPAGVVAADFGNDGKPDVAVTNNGDGTISLLFGAGTGTLASGGTLTAGGGPTWIVLADLNGDGHQDLIVANSTDNTISVLLGTGVGTFGPPFSQAVLASPIALAIGDLNRDGKPDLVVVNGYAGHFGVVGSTVQAFLGNGDGTFRLPATYAVGTNPQGVAIGDLDGDGNPDLVVTSASTRAFTALLGRGDGTFNVGASYMVGDSPTGIALADFNGDGKLDAVVGNSSDLMIYFGNGNGTFAVPTVIASGTPGVSNIIVADFNGDGYPDLAVGSTLLAGMGDGTFGASYLGMGGGQVAVDMNGDSRLDLVAPGAVLLNIGVVGSGSTITAQAGTPQSTTVNANFPVPMSVLVLSSTNKPLAGQEVVFSAPAIGPGGNFAGFGPVAQATTDVNGVATAPGFTANGVAGSYGVLASIGSTSTMFSLTNFGTSNAAPAFISAPLPNGALNVAYGYTIMTSGSPPPTLSTLAGSLPTGLALNGGTGFLSGIPTTAGTFAGSLTASNGVPPDATQTFSVTIAAASQAITFATPPNQILGAAPFAVSATSSSGLPVTFNSQTTSVCTVSGATVTIAAAGTCTIQAAQTGNSTFAPAPSVSRSFTVAKKPQTITFGPLFNRNLGSAPFSVSATATSALAVTFSSTTAAVCTASGAAVTLVNTGTCTVRAAQAGNSTFAAAPTVDQSFTVKPSGTDQPPSIIFKSPVNNSVYVAPAVIPLFATAGDPDGTIARVEFYSGSSLLGSATSAPYSFVWTNVAAGTYLVTAKAYDDLGVSTATATISINVNASGSTIAFAQAMGAPIRGTPVPGDFNGDGKLDVVSSMMQMELGNGDGTFAPPAPSGPGVPVPCAFMAPVFIDAVSGDFNGDGKRDVAMIGIPGVAVVGTYGCVRVNLSNGDGSWRAQNEYAVGFWPQAVAVGDFTGDGKLDLVTANSDGTVGFFRGNGDGTLQAPVVIAAGTVLKGVAVGDFNNDGKLDVLATNPGTATLRLLLGNGNGTFQVAQTLALGAGHSPFWLATGDFNGDGKLDAAVTNQPGNIVTVLIGNGDGTFMPPVDYPAGSSPYAIVAADLNADGWLDLAVANGDWTSSLSVLLGNGNGSFRAPVTLPVAPTPIHLAVGDFTGDGRPDLVADGTDLSIQNSGSLLVNVTGVATHAPVFTSVSPPDGSVGTPYSFAFTATGSPPPVFSFSSSTHYFNDLMLASNGALSSNSPSPGIHQGTILARNGIAPDATQNFTLVIRKTPQTINFPPISDKYFGGTCNGFCFQTPLIVTTSANPTADPYGLLVTLSSLTPSVCSVDANAIVSLLSVGTCLIRAEQPGDSYYAAAPTVDRSFSITLAPAVVAITSPADHAGFVAPANIPLTASAVASQGYTVTRVNFFRDGVLIGTATTAPYTVTWSNVPVGTYSLVAQSTQHAGGASTDIVTASTPIVIIVSSSANAATVALTAPANGSKYFAPATIALAATASNPSGTIAKVDFYNGQFPIGTVVTPPYTFNWLNVPFGTYNLTARATSGTGVVVASAVATVSVDLDAATPLAIYSFDDGWDSSGLVQDLIGGFYGERQGNVVQLAAPASAPKPDTCKAASFTGGTIDVNGLDVSTVTGARTTVAFWMKWNGSDGAMPLSWSTGGLLLSTGGFGFTTGSGDVYGIASATLANGWHHVAAEFNNGSITANRLSIDGAAQTLTQRIGTPNVANAVVSGSLRMGGQYGTSALRFSGQLDEVEIFGGGFSPSHVAALAATATPCAPLSVMLATPINSAAYVEPATIEFVAGAATQNGFISRVEFYDGNTLLGTAFGTSSYRFHWTSVPAGTYTVTAKAYDSTGASAVSSAVTVTVNPPPAAHPNVNISAPAAGATFYSSGTFAITAAVTGSPGYTVTQARFRANGALLGLITGAPWTYNWINPSPGAYSLTVEIVDNVGYATTSAPVSVTVLSNLPPAVSMTAPLPGQTFSAPGSITLSATASDPDGTVAKVEFYTGTTLLGTKTTAPFTFAWSGVAAGAYTLTAKATDNLGATTTSAAVSITVAATPTITMTAPSAGSAYATGQAVSMAAQASTPGHTLSRIDFTSDGGVVGSVAVPGGVSFATVSYSWNSATNGIHALRATAVASDGFTVTSAILSIEVSDFAVTLAEPFSGQAYQPPADIRITANPTVTGGTIAQVDFYGDGALLGSRTAPPYALVWTSVPVGTHTVSAKARDTAGFSVASPATTVTVLAAPTIQVDAGIDGASVADDNVSISGTVQAPLNSAVIVNGKAAALNLNGQFVVDNILLQPGSNTLTLVLNTQDGTPVTRTIALASTGVAPFQVTLDPQEGLAPLTATMIITNRGKVAFQRIDVDLNDDGTPEQTLTSLTDDEAVLTLTFPTPGIRTVRVKVFDAANNLIYSTLRKVLARDPRDVGSITVAVFNGMIDKLRVGNISSALNAVTGGVQDKYRAIFTSLQPALGTIAGQIGTIQRITLTSDLAELAVVRNSNSGLQTFSVYLIRSEDGIWRIDGM